MISEAEEFAIQDKKRREMIEVSNEIDSLIDQINKKMEENKDNPELEQLVAGLKEVRSSDDIEKLKLSLSEAQQKFASFNSPAGTEKE